jgi:hypothetical protein
MPTGRIYEGHGVATLGAHTKNRNGIARAVVLVGNYNDYRPTDAQIENIAQLLVDEWHAGHLQHPRLNGGHRDVPNGTPTECPGRWGEEFIGAINDRAAELAAAAPTTTEDDDPMANLTDTEEGRRLLDAAEKVFWLAEQIKPQTDRLQDEDAQTDALMWAVTDPEQGLRVQLAALQGTVAGMAAAMHALTSGAGIDFERIAKVAEDAAHQGAREGLAQLGEALRLTGQAPSIAAVTEPAPVPAAPAPLHLAPEPAPAG